MNTSSKLISFISSSLLFLSFSQTAEASACFWKGTDPNNSNWNTLSLWGCGKIPTATDDALINVAGGYCTIDSSTNVQAQDVIVGQHALNGTLNITGGSLTVSGATGYLFVGQYADGSGTLSLSSGTVTVPTNLCIGMTGPGIFYMSGGTVNLGGLFQINRYSNTLGPNYAKVIGGSIQAGNLSINGSGHLVMTNASLLLSGNQTNTVQGYINSGAFSTFGGFPGPIQVSYSSFSNTTQVSIDNTAARMGGISTFLQNPSITGDRAVSFSYTSGERFIQPTLPAGIHPRIYFGPDEIPDVRNRLTTTQFGQAAFTQIQTVTALMRNGGAWYRSQPTSYTQMPDGTPRFANVGLFDQSAVYQDLCNGISTSLAANGVAQSVLSGEMALEAFECLMLQGQPGIATRAQNLAQAMNIWCLWALTQSTLSPSNTIAGGGVNMAFCYDLNYWALTPAQIVNVRKVLAKMIPTVYPGMGLPPESATVNWISLNSFQLLKLCAIEGEATLAEDGYSAANMNNFFHQAMQCYYTFLTYGWNPSGSPTDSLGKDAISATSMMAYARRGYDYFGHSTVQNYMRQYKPAILQPFGYGLTEYDDYPGSSVNETYGYLLYDSSDYIGLKWAFPDDPASDLLWNNFINTRWQSNGAWQTYLDCRENKFIFRSVYYNNLLEAAIFALDPSGQDATAQTETVLGSLDYLDKDGATMVARSGFDANATALQVHIRQNFGGHTSADRGMFTLSALGRIWSKDQAFSTNQAGVYHSIIQVDDKDMYITPQDGNKMMIPSKLAAWESTSDANFVTGDQTYAYNWAWKWVLYPQNKTFNPTAGWQTEASTFNQFRRSNNQLPEAYASIPFYAFPYWNNNYVFPLTPNLYGIQKQPYNTMRQVYRTIGLVRGVQPYVLIIDDVQKDLSPHDYQWLAQMPLDLQIVSGSNLDPGLNPNTDIVMMDPASNNRLLVRIVEADGTPVLSPQAIGGSSLAYLLSVAVSGQGNRNRLVIERTNVIAPNFRVLLYPYTEGDELPVTVYQNNVLAVQIGAQTDTFTFYPRTATVAGVAVTMNEFVLSRDGTVLLDYRNQIEPATVR